MAGGGWANFIGGAALGMLLGLVQHLALRAHSGGLLLVWAGAILGTAVLIASRTSRSESPQWEPTRTTEIVR